MRCQKCKRTLPRGKFGTKPDGKTKGWCKKCCTKGSEKLLRMHERRRARGWKPNPWQGKSYASRSYILKVVGFSSYREYLKSELWDSIRFRVFMSKGESCHLCSKPATQVHHTRYTKATLLGRKLKYLIPICGGCHYKVEFSKERKLTVKGAIKKLEYLEYVKQAPPAFVQSQ